MKRSIIACVWLLVLLASEALPADPVKIGFLFTMSGRGAAHGVTAKQGAEIALAEVNASGGILGRKVVGVFEDEGAPDAATQRAENLVKTEKVNAIIGVISSAVAPRVAAVAKGLQVPLIITTAQTNVVTGQQCNRYTFRMTWNNDQALKTVALVAAEMPAKTWTTVGPDYALGWESWDLFQKYLKEIKPEISFLPKSEAVFAPMDITDWKPHIKTLEASKANGILVSLWGGNLIDFMREARQAGLLEGERTVLCCVASESELVSLGSQAPAGFWVVTPYWSKANPTQVNDKFVETYREKFGSPPSYQAQFAYAGVKAYSEAARKAATVDSDAVVKSLEGLTMELPVGHLTIRAEDHQAIFPGVAGRVSSRFEVTKLRRPFRGLDSIKRIPAEQIAVPVEKTGCQMQ
ncbi:MAG: ABC transporter substrate-binding protein [Desulfomonile tiedjei]|nr:ABC transporter substrate-binding protein [Desulfomonile tiedjei]